MRIEGVGFRIEDLLFGVRGLSLVCGVTGLGFGV